MRASPLRRKRPVGDAGITITHRFYAAVSNGSGCFAVRSRSSGKSGIYQETRLSKSKMGLSFVIEATKLVKLTPRQVEYLDHELFHRGRTFVDEYYAEKDRIHPLTPEEHSLSTDQIEAARIRRLARDLIEVRTATFIEVFTEFKKFPDEEDYNRFRDSSRNLLFDQTMRMFEEACRNFFARPAHETVAEAIRTCLPMELQKILTDGMKPVTSFLLKGKAQEEDMEETFSQREMAVLKKFYDLTGGKPGVMVEIDNLATELNVPVSEMNGFIHSLETKGYIGGINEAVWIEPKGIGEIEGERPTSLDSQPRIRNTTNKSDEVYKWDAFICHASEDKDSFVKELAATLQTRGLRIWYDEFTLRAGDSLRRSMDRGLADSRFGIVVLSPQFFQKEWPQKELDALAGRESNGTKVILPIWLNLTAEDVANFSPMLADRVAILAMHGISEAVNRILQAIGHNSDDALRQESQIRYEQIILLHEPAFVRQCIAHLSLAKRNDRIIVKVGSDVRFQAADMLEKLGALHAIEDEARRKYRSGIVYSITAAGEQLLIDLQIALPAQSRPKN